MKSQRSIKRFCCWFPLTVNQNADWHLFRAPARRASPGPRTAARRSNLSAIVLLLASAENNETAAAGNVLIDLLYDSTVSSEGRRITFLLVETSHVVHESSGEVG